jgi:hypothetical protein
MRGNPHVRFGGGRLETQVKLCAGRLSYCLFCCRSQADAEAALEYARKCLARLDLAVNPRKTTIYHAERGLHYLGERLLLKKRGPYEELVHVPRARMGKATRAVAAPLALPAATETVPAQEAQWVPSTSPNKAP